MQAIVVPSRYF